MIEQSFQGVQPILYQKQENKVLFLDQTKLPVHVQWIEVDSVEICWDAIRRLAVRGAPAIGIAAAFGLAVAVQNVAEDSGYQAFFKMFQKAKTYLASSRPTAVNLFWALERMEQVVDASEQKGKTIPELKEILFEEAQRIQQEDMLVCKNIGEYGQEILKDGMGILTHCNAGSLATSIYGTALAPIYIARERGMDIKVFADETRPLLQGSRLTAYELLAAGIDVTVIADNMAATVMSKGWVQACIVGCDRLAANGDAANKIGTHGVAVLANSFEIPFYIACPISTIDVSLATGIHIPIEERAGEEITMGFGCRTAPEGVKTYNPAFDVTPNRLISGIITERGILRPPYNESIQRIMEGSCYGKSGKECS